MAFSQQWYATVGGMCQVASVAFRGCQAVQVNCQFAGNLKCSVDKT